jgi:acyl carrier protein
MSITTTPTVRTLIIDQVQRLRADRGLTAIPIEDGTPMLDGLGLDSLDMATLVAILEQHTGRDPFVETIPAFRTFGEFVALYD